jgi:hypothetical protein
VYSSLDENLVREIDSLADEKNAMRTGICVVGQDTATLGSRKNTRNLVPFTDTVRSEEYQHKER